MLIVSGIAALIMLAGALLLGGDMDDHDDDHPDEGEELNLRAILLDTAADAAAAAGVAAAGVAAAGAVIFDTCGLYWLDPAIALIIAVVVAWHAVRLLRRIGVALRATPARSAAA